MTADFSSSPSVARNACAAVSTAALVLPSVAGAADAVGDGAAVTGTLGLAPVVFRRQRRSPPRATTPVQKSRQERDGGERS
jgi:hypothetical protein